MADSKELPTNTDLPPGARSGADRTRRRLLQGGLGAAPLLTLVSRPVLGNGGGGQCATASAFMSAGSAKGTLQSCSGRTPGYWKQPQHFNEWPPGYYPGATSREKKKEKDGDGEDESRGRGGPKAANFSEKHGDDDDGRRQGEQPWGHRATRFSAVFSPSPYPSTTTLLDVLEIGGGPPNLLGRHLVASLLNVQKGWVSVLTVPKLQGMWREYMMVGFFQPTAGVRWYHDDIVGYLASTMPL